MLTIKYRDCDGFDRISEARDIRAKMDDKFAALVAWTNDQGEACSVEFDTTVYVMNENGSTVAKYVVLSYPRNVGSGDIVESA